MTYNALGEKRVNLVKKNISGRNNSSIVTAATGPDPRGRSSGGDSPRATRAARVVGATLRFAPPPRGRLGHNGRPRGREPVPPEVSPNPFLTPLRNK